MIENNSNNLLKYTIGDKVWFIASEGDTLSLYADYGDNKIDATNTTYRFIKMPVCGTITSLYVTQRRRSPNTNLYHSVGGSRLYAKDLNELNKLYNPETDILHYEVATTFSPGMFNVYTSGFAISSAMHMYPVNYYDLEDLLTLHGKTKFLYGRISVDYNLVAGCPEEAMQKFLTRTTKRKNKVWTNSLYE